MGVMNMMTRRIHTGFFLLMCGLVSAFPGNAASQEAQSIKLGEAALRFAGGSIRQTVPQDGIVNFITGDSQTTGNRMILGWRDSEILYIKLHRPEEAALGDLYTVYRRTRKVFHPRTRNYMGYIVNQLAVVRIIQIDHGLATVQIVRSFAPLSPGDSIMRFAPPAADEGSAEPHGAIDGEAMIVDLQADKNMSLVGQGNLVYLDRGRGNGIRPGDRFEVNRLGGGLPRRKIADIKILSAEEETATAVITRSVSRVLVGDRVHHKDSVTTPSLRSDQELFQLQDRSPLIAAATPQPPAGGTDQPGIMVRTVPVDGTTRIDLEALVEQLEYESGEVRIRPAGLPLLDRIADYLKATVPDKPIRVEGHADNMEIGPSLRSVFASNWELSRARAAGIVRHLVEKGGLDSARLNAVGYGATRPVASNATEEGRKRNRRIEIVLYTVEGSLPMQETAGTGTDSPPSSGEQVNSQPTSIPMPVKESTSVVTPSDSSVPMPKAVIEGQLDSTAPSMQTDQPSAVDSSDARSAMTPTQ